jgi:hypothetical protein
VTFTWSAGLTVSAADVTSAWYDSGTWRPITCTAETDHRMSCPVGRLGAGLGGSLTLPVHIGRDVAVGTPVSLTVTATALDGTPYRTTDSTQTWLGTVIGRSVATVNLTANHRSTTLGSTVTVTVTVHNSGRQTALHLYVWMISQDARGDSRFRRVAFDGPTAWVWDVIDSGKNPDREGYVVWAVPAIPPGATATSHLTLRATSPGPVVLLARATYWSLGNGVGEKLNCPGGCTQHLDLAAAPTSTRSSGTAGLAATGTTTSLLLVTGAALLLAGATCLHLSRRPRRASEPAAEPGL